MREQSTCLRRFLQWSVVTVGLLSASGGCGFDGNSRKEFVKGNVVFQASKNPLGVDYYYVVIGSPRLPYSGVPVFAFELGGQRLLSDHLDVDALKRRTQRVEKAMKYDEGWRNGEDSIQVGPYVMVFQGHDLVQFMASVYYSLNEPPYIGKADSDRLYGFPLSESQVIDIFGRPDATRNWLSW